MSNLIPPGADIEDDDELLEETVKAVMATGSDDDINRAVAQTYNKDLFIYSLEFDEGGLVVTFGYKDEVKDELAQQRTLRITLSNDNYKILFCELQDRLDWLINDALPRLRD